MGLLDAPALTKSAGDGRYGPQIPSGLRWAANTWYSAATCYTDPSGNFRSVQTAYLSGATFGTTDTFNTVQMPYGAQKLAAALGKARGFKDQSLVNAVMASPPTVTGPSQSTSTGSLLNTIYQTIVVGTATSYTVTYNGNTSGSIAAGASTATVQTALQAITGVGAGNVLVTGASPNYQIQFTGALAANSIALTITPTGGTATVTGNGVTVPAVSTLTTEGQVNHDKFTYTGAGGFVPAGTTSPTNRCVKATSLTGPTTGQAYKVHFMFHGTTIGIKVFEDNTNLLFRVDGVLVSATATALPNNNINLYETLLTFATAGPRLITIEGDSQTCFAGVFVGPNDSIAKAEVRGPRGIIFGTSIELGVGSSPNNEATFSWPRQLGQIIGCDDIWQSAVSGAGYKNVGLGSVTLRTRLATDYTPFGPFDFVIWAGLTVNDMTSNTAAAIAAEALLCWQAVQTATPGVPQFVISCESRGDISLQDYVGGGSPANGNSFLATKDALLAAVLTAQAAGIPVQWIDHMEMPIGGSVTPASGTVAVATSGGASSFTSTTYLGDIGDFVELYEPGSPITNQERRRLRGATTFSSPNYTYRVNPASGTPSYGLAFAHTTSAVCRRVGPSIWTGKGKVGNLTYDGNSDQMFAASNPHPTSAGHLYFAWAVARLMARRVLGG